MSSRFVMANIKMPIEITHDNIVKPLQHLSNVYVVSIIDSITDIIIDRTLPDVITQADHMFQTRTIDPIHVEPLQPSYIPIVKSDEQGSVPAPVPLPVPAPVPNTTSTPPFQLWIHPEELHKSTPAFKQNTTFKHRSKYNHRSTSKHRDSL